MDQEFAELVRQLFDVQEYPDLREYPEGPPEQPYDAAGWTLPLQMGVNARAALMAVDLARDGVEGPRDVLEGRYGYFALFEHAFSLGKLELWLGFMGNSGGERFGAMIVELKFALAFTVALALVTAELTPRVRWRVVGCCGAFLLLRVGHIVLSMTIARGTVHSPHADVAPVFLTLVMLATLVAFAVVLAAVTPRARDERAATSPEGEAAVIARNT